MLDVPVGSVFGCTSSSHDVFFSRLGYRTTWETGLVMGEERDGEKKRTRCPNLLKAIGGAPRLGRDFLFLVVKV
jgi:hypothetical protein